MFGLFDPLHPGRIYLLATGLPLMVFFVLLITGYLRNSARSIRQEQRWFGALYWVLGGDRPGRLGGWLALTAMIGSSVISFMGLIQVLREYEQDAAIPALLADRWSESVEWIHLGGGWENGEQGLAISIGYRIDVLTAMMFSMVTFIGSWIFMYSLGYMREEAQAKVIDHEVTTADHQGHPRRGRFGRFYLFLSLFAFAMLHLLIADNLFQIFMSWELVGVCSFFLIGFYGERPAAGSAANKAFIINRLGDVGFIIGLAIYWANFQTFNLVALTSMIADRPELLTSMPLTIAGIGIFLGCAGKSAQFPLHTWLPDAMEGPTPVSALIHAATMVAAGVYLVGRCLPIFPTTTLLVIAYSGAITAFIAASIAMVQTDIKRVLAYSTISQLGFMMLALGIGGWVAGMMHLLTHAFFKALLFLGSGSVIHGLHHIQDLREMGGLRKKMPITAWTMFIGVLAIIGMPLFSGWYSKDRILADSLGFVMVHQQHTLLFWLAIVSVGLTGFYMLRLWCLTFAGSPRNLHAYEHAHESPFSMVVPLIVLAACGMGIAWGWPVWSVEASGLGHLVEFAQPDSVHDRFHIEHLAAEEEHGRAGLITLAFTLLGAWIAISLYAKRELNPSAWRDIRFPLYRFLRRRWYFDEIYGVLILKPTIAIAKLASRFDRRTEGDPQLGDRTLDGLVSTPGLGAGWLATRFHRIQSGRLRGDVVVLLLTAVVTLAMLMSLARLSARE